MTDASDFGLILFLGFILGVFITGMIILAGGFDYNGIQTIHVTDKYPYGDGTFTIVTCDQVYYTSDPLSISKISENGTYKIKFSVNPLRHFNMITDVIGGDVKPSPSGCN